MDGAINLTPVLEVLAWVVVAGIALFIGFWVLFFAAMIVWAPFQVFSDLRKGEEVDELSGGIVFAGAIIIVVALIVLAFTSEIVAIE